VSTPVRIQRKRTKGWRMPAEAIYVGRPSRWGNPFRVGDRFVNQGAWSPPRVPYPETFLPVGERAAKNGWGQPYTRIVAVIQDRAQAVGLFRAFVRYENVGQWDPDELRLSLTGHDLACWCPLDQPCHADVLLELANGGDE